MYKPVIFADLYTQGHIKEILAPPAKSHMCTQIIKKAGLRNEEAKNMGRQLIKTTTSQLAGRAAYLFGAGKIGRATLEYLRGIVDLRGILDNNKKEMVVAGTAYPVSPPSATQPPATDLFAGQGSETQLSAELRLQEAIVIVAVLDYEPVVQQLKALGWPESKIFISVSWKIPFADDPERSGYEALSFSEAEARGLLADSYSKTLYDFILENRGGSVNLYQYGQLSPIRGSHGYWEDMPVPSGLDCAIMDCGAYEGDSILQILEAVSPKRCTYYAFEPDDHAYPILEKAEERISENVQTEQKALESLRFVNIHKGVWLKDADLTFHYHWEDAASTLSDNQNLKTSDDRHLRAAGSQEPETAEAQGFIAGESGTVKVTSIDQIQALEKDMFIKMDIEGAEAAAIRGAEKTIREKRPFLAVCAYHRPSDLFLLPALIKSLNPNYRIFLRGGLHYAYYAIDEAYL